tara:strand:- start:8086 stop:8727 length:642 start_codon:yes stop_codon:yes gene_type:complete
MKRKSKYIIVSALSFQLAHAELITADSQDDAIPSLENRVTALERNVQTLNDMNLLAKLDQLKNEITTLNRQIDFLQKPSQNVSESNPTAQLTNLDQGPSMRKVYGLIAQQQNKEARSVLKELAQKPNGHDPAEIEFWQGELAYQEKDFNAASQFFKSVINSHPDHSRAPDSLFKLAEIAKETGDAAQAERLLATLKIQYPDAIATQYSSESKN